MNSFLKFEALLETMIVRMNLDDHEITNPSPVDISGDYDALIKSFQPTFNHELEIQLTNFLESYDVDNLEKHSIHTTIEDSDDCIVLSLRDPLDSLVMRDLIYICESSEERMGTYLTPNVVDDTNNSSIGIVRSIIVESDETKYVVKMLGGKTKSYDDSIHLIYTITNVMTSFRQWKNLESPKDLQILNAKPQDYNKLKRRKNYKIYAKHLYERCNESQKQCFDVIGTHFTTSHRRVHMIHGPPGTGKTTTMIAIALNLLEGDSNTKILYTTTCNSTIEKLMLDIYDEPMFHKHIPVIIGHHSRVGKRVQKYTLSAYVKQVVDIFKLLSKTTYNALKMKMNSYKTDLERINKLVTMVSSFPIPITKSMTKYNKDLSRHNDLVSYIAIADLSETLKTWKEFINQSNGSSKLNSLMRNNRFKSTPMFKQISKKVVNKFSSIPTEDVIKIIISRLQEITDKWYHRLDRKISETKIKSHCRLFLCTTSVSGSHNLNDVKIDRVFIEEAAQTILVDSLIPLTKYTKHLVLAGDPKQLEGMVYSEESRKCGYDMSLMHYFENISTTKRNHQKLLLRIQYRMHPDISVFPNLNFYKNELIDSEYVKNRPTLVAYGLPTYKVINLVNTTEKQHPSIRSYCNYEEAEYIRNILEQLLQRHPDFDLRRITIITPYAGQVLLLRTILGRFKNLIQISSIDGIQGKENDVIIASMVRVGDSIGFNNDRHRINVLLTRARFSTYLVGNFSTFQKDRLWSKLIKNAKDRRVFDTQKYDSKI